MEWLMDNIGLVIAVVIGVLFVVGLALALRTEGGRDRLAAAAVRLAVAALGLAERWLGEQIAPASSGNVVAEARGNLRGWLLARSETGQSGAGL